MSFYQLQISYQDNENREALEQQPWCLFQDLTRAMRLEQFSPGCPAALRISIHVHILLSLSFPTQGEVAVCQPRTKRLLMTQILDTENWTNSDALALSAFFGSGNKF